MNKTLIKEIGARALIFIVAIGIFYLIMVAEFSFYEYSLTVEVNAWLVGAVILSLIVSVVAAGISLFFAGLAIFYWREEDF